ncbi:MAG: EAL domain-containing protein [Leptolyngbyaceae cyanobacterium RU_5_1]|nr:EAL domain-containing protein [Leptolyngbyaceae cyanobacterium RU_5_1]
MNYPQHDSKAVDVLVVDDTPENIRLLSIMLSKKGYHVRKAINGKMGLTAVQAHLPDLILLDITMPDIDGYEVCQRLKANPKTSDVPVIFLSALGDSLDKVKAFNVGGADYITKPFQIEEILARVNHQLALRKAEQEIRQLNAQLEDRVKERTQQLASANAKLLKLALCDPLTGLANRFSFMERLEQALHQAKNDVECQFAILFLDCDRFKIVNDSLGHLVGDELLQAIADRLQQLLKPSDTLARLGGDEFAMLLTHIAGIDSATQLADRMLNTFSQPFSIRQQQVFISASIGIALSSSEYEQPEHLLRDADTAMYHAKASGRAQYQIFEPTMHTAALQQLLLETDLRRAINQQEFVIHYQPIVALKTGKIAGLEALVRWQHPTRGLVSPAAFIPIAEETRLINQIGNWVLRTACHQLSFWQKRGFVDPTFSISVNLSACQFAQVDLVEQIIQILAETQLNPHCLKLEITESAIMDNPEAAAVILEQLRQHQIQLSMDDFGTGYSSLNYLQSFPMDNLKIDRSFVQCLDETQDSLGLVPVIKMIAKTMNMKVIAEGIETTQQLIQLKALNCDFGQGYLFSKPLEAEEIITLLASPVNWRY